MTRAGVDISAIKLFALDVDGVLTDGRIIIDNHGVESKFFHVRDGLGLRLLRRAGLKVALITGRSSAVVEIRARELGLDYVRQNIEYKVPEFESIRDELGISDDQAAYAGDDLVDLELLKKVGLGMAPADASEEIIQAADFVSRFPGGRGAVREMSEYILKSSGRWTEVFNNYP